MRKIKFKWWDSVDKYFIKDDSFCSNLPVNEMFEEMQIKYKLIPLQYTGRNDKNGIELYDGDIIKFDDEEDKEVYFIYYKYESFRFITKSTFDDGWNGQELGDISNCIGFTIIGNIYENPELLKHSN